MNIRFPLIVLFVVFSIFFGCKERDKSLEDVIAEVEKKETELKEVGVPKFILEEQKQLETNTIIEQKSVDQVFEFETNVVPKVSPRGGRRDETEIEIERKVEPIRVVPKETSKKFLLDRPKKVSKFQSKRVLTKPSSVDLKVYFSYSSGKKYVDRKNPGKITSVVYAGKGIWYVDFEVYAVPYSRVSEYERILKDSYIIGKGRNISVVDGRSQLTVYWTGRNLKKNYLPNGKYSIVVKAKFKNMKKMVMTTYTKVLGIGSPLVVILAN